mgnify:CR=1 FL=1
MRPSDELTPEWRSSRHVPHSWHRHILKQTISDKIIEVELLYHVTHLAQKSNMALTMIVIVCAMQCQTDVTKYLGSNQSLHSHTY